MKLSLPYIRKIGFVALSLASFAIASEADIKKNKEESLDTAYMTLTTVPALSPILVFSGVPLAPVIINAATSIGSQWALCELLGHDNTEKIKKSPHSKRFILSGILVIGSLTSTAAYYITGSNTYWMVNALCSTASSLITMIGTGIMFEELSPKHKPKESNSSAIWSQCTTFWKKTMG